MKLFRKAQQGFSIIMVVILIVLFALIGGYMATLVGVGSINTTTSVGSMQAWFAARSGIEWAVRDLIVGSGACSAPTINLSGGGTNGFSVVLTCTASSFTEAGIGAYNVYALTSKASRGSPGDIAYVARQLNVSITDAP